MTGIHRGIVLGLAGLATISVTGCSVFGLGGSAVKKPPANTTIAAVQSGAKATNKQTIEHDLNSLHDDANQWVGYSATPDWGPWSQREQKDYLPAVQNVVQEVKSDAQNATTKAVVQDLNNAESLLQIAAKSHQRQALVYFHRIVSDLANYVYSNHQGDEYFGATHALKGSEASTIDQYVKQHASS